MKSTMKEAVLTENQKAQAVTFIESKLRGCNRIEFERMLSDPDCKNLGFIVEGILFFGEDIFSFKAQIGLNLGDGYQDLLELRTDDYTKFK